jgi:hypothetical protein
MTIPEVTGTVISFDWQVAGSDPDGVWTHNWDQPYSGYNWTSGTFTHTGGTGTYALAVVEGPSFAIGTRSICYAGNPAVTVKT